MGDGTSSVSTGLVGPTMLCRTLLLSSRTRLGAVCLRDVCSLFLLSPGSASTRQTSPGFPTRVIFSSWNIKSALGLVTRAWIHQISADLPAPANAGLN